MTARSIPRRLFAIWAVGVVVLAAFGGGAFTAAYFEDRESATASISASSDFTVAVGNVAFSPDHLETDSSGKLKVSVVVPDRGAIDESRFTLSARETDGSIHALSASCGDPADGWDCTVRFSRQSVVDLVPEPGTYTFVLRGWWDYGRDFEAAGDLPIEDAGNTGTTTAGNTDTKSSEYETDTTTSTTSTTSRTTNAQTTTTGGNTGTDCSSGNTSGDCGETASLVSPSSLPAATTASSTSFRAPDAAASRLTR